MRFFRSQRSVASVIRNQVVLALEQPNGKAEEPWPVDGDFVIGDEVYLALGAHHTEGSFWSVMLASAISNGVEEITAEQFFSARPVEQP
jgi:hypothetical protein